MSRQQFVIDPDGTDCYGKYEMATVPDIIPNNEIVDVDDLDRYEVIEWRYEDY